jgi:hypothetical protein
MGKFNLMKLKEVKVGKEYQLKIQTVSQLWRT